MLGRFGVTALVVLAAAAAWASTDAPVPADNSLLGPPLDLTDLVPKTIVGKLYYYENTGQWLLALDTLDEYLNVYPNDVDAAVHFGTCYYALGEIDKAYASFLEYYNNHQRNWYGVYSLGIIEMCDYHKFDEARKYFEESLEFKDKTLQQEFLSRHYLSTCKQALAKIALDNKEMEKAKALLEETLEEYIILEALLKDNPKVGDTFLVGSEGYTSFDTKSCAAGIAYRKAEVEVCLDTLK